ncbi:MAG TPA: Asp-tRNA(Asn)/Glu-tRNA(Gln) amidotransferase subunit GatC [Gemmatimonadota bacterium]|nr:Asp-tRNA(Asn)/Glu-tRNA(Gln) amidotransferase subunit GatC [Gemmatimonadota bacterium]
MSIGADDVRHIARLARLDLSEEEVQRFRRELSAILEYVNRLEELEPGRAAQPEPPDQPLREDRVVGWPDPSWFLDQAPSRDGFFLVPRVVE